MTYQADEYLCPRHKPGTSNITYKTLHFCIPCWYCKSGTFTSVLFMGCGLILRQEDCVSMEWGWEGTNGAEDESKEQQMRPGKRAESYTDMTIREPSYGPGYCVLSLLPNSLSSSMAKTHTTCLQNILHSPRYLCRDLQAAFRTSHCQPCACAVPTTCSLKLCWHGKYYS